MGVAICENKGQQNKEKEEEMQVASHYFEVFHSNNGIRLILLAF